MEAQSPQQHRTGLDLGDHCKSGQRLSLSVDDLADPGESGNPGQRPRRES
jgi:hypothetical protein